MSKMSKENQRTIYKETVNISTNHAKVNDTLESGFSKYPYSEKLKIDEHLRYSHDKKIITDLLNKNFLSKTIIETLNKVIDFPTPYIFAKFASKAYENYDPQQKNKYEKDLPLGWKLLATATNSAIKNGYFGVAYCNLEKRQVVLAHRGTIFKNLGAIWTDVSAIACNKYAPQMSSACTFAHRIVCELNELNKDQAKFQLFFTGHSLGGWLAQVTTFTSKYLDITGNNFLKAEREGYHVHTEVFDSPGCKDMLSQMVDDFGLRHDDNWSSLSFDNLDITSYLSAPNRINTHNSHIGTIYRVFVDLSDITESNEYFKYNLKTHEMKKILNTFDQSKGQVRKDNNGMKIKKVVDWPISSFLNNKKEYRDFFQWATRVNNYEPEVELIEFHTKLNEKHDHFPIRYQVKNVNWDICSSNIFTQEEFLFLENYQTLRKLPEKFQPKDLFSEINDLTTEQNIKDVLGDFKIKNKKIICDNEKLQKLIHYVKNLLHYLPTIRDKVEKGFTENGIKKAIIDSISLNNLVYEHFKCFAETDVVKPLNMDTQASLLFVNEDTCLWLAKIYKTLYEKYSKEKVVILNLKELLHLKKISPFTQEMKDFVDDLTCNKSLILFECKLNFNINENEEIKNFIKHLFQKLNNENIKVIFVTRISKDDKRNDDKLEDLMKSTARELNISLKIKMEKPLTWLNFSVKYQEELLNRPFVIFQEQKEGTSLMSLKRDKDWGEFIHSNKDPNFLMQLINNDNIKIDSIFPRGFDESHYINRVFIYQVEIETEIFAKKNNEDDLWAISNTDKETFSRLISDGSEIRFYHERDPEKEKPNKFIIIDDPVAEKFEQLCQQYPKFNIYGLKYKPDKKTLKWKKSQGSVSELFKFVSKSHTKEYDEIKMLQKTNNHKVVIISDTAGMGKSTVLTKLYHLIRSKSPNLWLFRIDLNDYTKKLFEIKDKNALNVAKNDKIKEVFKFMSNNLYEANSLKQNLFMYYCQNDTNISKMVIMFDGFDEISPDYKKVVLDMVQVLSQSAVKQIWVTTRPNMLNFVADGLNQFAFTLKPFSTNDQQNFLINFWNKNILESNNNSEDQDRLKEFVKLLTESFAKSIHDNAYEFTGIPLQTKMLAEVFEKPCIKFLKSKDDKPNLPNSFKIFELYENFFKKKHEVFLDEKIKIDSSKPGIPNKLLYEEFIKSYQIIALHTIFNTKINEKHLLSNKSQKKIKSFIDGIKKGKQNHGIIDQIIEDKPHFIHRTYAEYLVARFLVNSLNKQKKLQSISELFLNILSAGDYQVIRVFINDQLEKDLFPDICQLNNQDYLKKSTDIIQFALIEKNINIIRLITQILRIDIKEDGFYCKYRRQIVDQIMLLDKDGFIQYVYGRYDMAINFFLQTYKLKQLIYDSPHQEIANSLNNIGTTYAKIGQYDQAIEYLNQSKNMQIKFIEQNKLHSKKVHNLAVYLNNLGSAHWNKSKYAQAIEYYRQALFVILKKAPLSKELKGIKNSLLKLFAKRCSLNLDEIKDNISFSPPQEVDLTKHLNNIALSIDVSNEEKKTEKIKKYELLLLFYPDLKNKSQVITE
ncbi:uncharacterized protein LOC136078150 [Hydra vulgaris]|uniref:Uncharacterized protein LOC136078150 n=1 Tax=Hydra vulgaris TaxID=6087 RepID=A0ABM4BJQ7_HYDVU